MELAHQIESILFVASRPLSFRALAKAVAKSEAEVKEAIALLSAKHQGGASGLRVIANDEEVQMGTDPNQAAVVDGFIKDEIAGELTRAQLETLTVVAYRGPITRPELEQIRGVNCALILRHLMMRGLVEEGEDGPALLPTYRLSLEALRHLGIASLDELPEYATLHAHEYIEQTLAQMTMSRTPVDAPLSPDT